MAVELGAFQQLSLPPRAWLPISAELHSDFCFVQSLTSRLRAPAFPKHVKGYRALLFAAL